MAKLHAAVYGVSVEVDYFPKKYNTTYIGVEYVGFLAYDQSAQPVAYFGVIPCFCNMMEILFYQAGCEMG